MRDIERVIARGTFDYLAQFPQGSRRHLFAPKPADGAITFKDYIVKWHLRRSPFLANGQVMQSPELHPTTFIHDESVIGKHLIPAFGHLRLDEITVSQCNDFGHPLKNLGLSGKTIANVMGFMRKALGDAVDEDLISRNPIRRTSARRLGAERRRQVSADPFTPPEIAKILS